MVELSRLERVDLREVWPNEAQDFTPWLTNNLDLLGEVLGLDLEVREREAQVGAFSLDILAHDLGSDRPVVIENQLQSSDHDHLGKLLTYAAGYDAHVVVWLVQDFRPEHHAALDWLNQRSSGDTAFFGVAVEVWRIGGSPPAPRLNPVAVPNDWQQQVASAQHGDGADGISEKLEQYRGFFQSLMDVLREQHQFTQARKGQPQNWYQFSSGFSNIAYRATFVSREGRVAIDLYIARRGKLENERLFDQLAERRSQIEDALGYELQWKRLDQAKACRISNEREGSIDDDPETLAEIERWMVDNLLAFKRAFGPHLMKLLG